MRRTRMIAFRARVWRPKRQGGWSTDVTDLAEESGGEHRHNPEQVQQPSLSKTAIILTNPFSTRGAKLPDRPATTIGL
jgi:hypothetical protein